MKYFELYSGIGGFREALNHVSKDLGISCECVGKAELDVLARKMYNLHFNVSEEEYEISNIIPYRNTIDAGKQPPQRIECKSKPISYGSFDTLVADVPCEKYGSNPLLDKDTQLGNIIWMVNKFSPAHVIIEAPWNMCTYDKGKSLQSTVNALQYFGYHCFFCQLNSLDFGIPQDRKKVYIFASIKHAPFGFEFSQNSIVRNFHEMDGEKSIHEYNDIFEILERNVADLTMWMSDQSKKFIFNNDAWPKLNMRNCLSIKPGMSRIQYSNADNYYTRDFIESRGEIDESKTVPVEKWRKLKDVRRLTHKECLLLQGFGVDAYEDMMKCYIPDTAMYRMIGQSTNVNIAYAVLSYIIKMYEIK